jgi:glycopeptide antibiotics resistance protein
MWSFFGGFTDSFLFALLCWPFAAALLTLPVLLVQYMRFHRLHTGRVVAVYLLMLYGLGLAAFTLYPLPGDPDAFCSTHHLTPQLIPFSFIADIGKDGLSAVLQVVMTIVFFVPLGVFGRNFLKRKRLWPIVLAAFGVSLLVETAQLTGVAGFYPCSYRLFDVDDLMLNTLGAVLGYFVAGMLPSFAEAEKQHKINTRPGWVHRFVAFVSDHLLVIIAAMTILIPIRLLGGPWEELGLPIRLVLFGLVQFVLPLVGHGQTVFGKLTGISLDDRARGTWHRVVFYAARLLWVGAALFGTGMTTPIVIVITIFSWLGWKRLPYCVVDVLFKRR